MTDLTDIGQEHLSWLPRYLQGSYDAIALIDALARESEEFHDRINEFGKQLFVSTATWGLGYWEQALQLPAQFYSDDRPLDHPYTAAVKELEPTAYWRFSEGAGATGTPDVTSHGLDLTYVGNVSPGAAGALAGDASRALAVTSPYAGRATRPLTSALKTDVWTISAIIKVNASPPAFSILFDDHAGKTGRTVWVMGDGSIAVDVGNGGGASLHRAQTAASAIPPGAYHHLVVTYDNANVKIYLDGVLILTDAYVGGIKSTSVLNLHIGSSSGLTNPFSGNIDEMFIDDRALSADEITELYEASQEAMTPLLTDETRRTRVLAKLLSNKAVSGKDYRGVLDSFVSSYQLRMDHTGAAEGTLNITIATGSSSYGADALEALIRDITPAHLNINVEYAAFLAGISAAGDSVY